MMGALAEIWAQDAARCRWLSQELDAARFHIARMAGALGVKPPAAEGGESPDSSRKKWMEAIEARASAIKPSNREGSGA